MILNREGRNECIKDDQSIKTKCFMCNAILTVDYEDLFFSQRPPPNKDTSKVCFRCCYCKTTNHIKFDNLPDNLDVIPFCVDIRILDRINRV